MRPDGPWWATLLSPDTRRRIRPVVAPIVRNAPGRRPRWGNLRRARPFSAHYGFDRGQPVDRRYIERFLARMADRIDGDVLEVRHPEYSRRFGSPTARAHVLDIDPANTAATVIGDLCHPSTLPPEAYDCEILTQTLQFLDDPAAALTNLWRSLRAEGTLLVTVPSLARIDHELPGSDFWRWTPAGLRLLLERCCVGGAFEVEGGGNLIAALAALLGLAVEDLREHDLAQDAPAFPIIACAAVRKPERA